MLIDDSPIVCRVVGEALTSAGFEVVTRTNPIGTAAAIVRERPAVVLLDVSMPLLSGAEIAESVRGAAGGRRASILLHSDRPEEELRELTARCGADGWVRKSDRHAELVVRLRGLVGERTTPRPAGIDRRHVLVVVPDRLTRGRVEEALAGSMTVRSSDSGTAALIAVGSRDPPEILVVSTDVDDLSAATLAREALRADPTFRTRIVWVEGARRVPPPAVPGLDAPCFAPPFSLLRTTVEKLGRWTA